MKSTNVKSAREHLLNKYNLSLMGKTSNEIDALKCDAKSNSPSICLNPYVKSTVPYSRKRSMCFTQQMNLQKMKSQYISSSSQYINHNIKKCKLQECSESESTNSAIISSLGVNNATMALRTPPKIDFDAPNKEKTLLTFANHIPNLPKINQYTPQSGNQSFTLSTLNSDARSFENSSTFETLEFRLPANSKVSSIIVKDYSSKSKIASKTKLTWSNKDTKNEDKGFAKIEFDINDKNKNILANNSITNNTVLEKIYTLYLCDPNTIDPQTFIMSKRSYKLEINYDAL